MAKFDNNCHPTVGGHPCSSDVFWVCLKAVEEGRFCACFNFTTAGGFRQPGNFPNFITIFHQISLNFS